MNEPSSVRGPACVNTGPRVDVAVTSYIKGKPPHETFVTDMRVRNPLAIPVWLLYAVAGDGARGVPASRSYTCRVMRASPRPPDFYGAV